jgi:hypothetical protein
MKASFRPFYNKIINRKNLLIERFDSDESIWDGHYILEFNPNTRASCELLVSSEENNFPIDLINWGNSEYCSFKIRVLDDIGNGDSSNFVEWIDSFYNNENNYYRFNIYDNDARDMNLYIVSKSLKRISRFHLTSCVVKNPLFFEYNKSNNLSTQIALTLCTTHSIVINHII